MGSTAQKRAEARAGHGCCRRQRSIYCVQPYVRPQDIPGRAVVVTYLAAGLGDHRDLETDASHGSTIPRRSKDVRTAPRGDGEARI